MSTSTQFTTFADLYSGLTTAVRVTGGVSATDTIAKRHINTALHDMHIGFDYRVPWAERQARLIVRPSYTTGTVSIDKGSTTLTGSGTAWTTTDDFSIANARANGRVTINGGRIPYIVSSVGGAESITLTSQFTEDDVSDGSYVYFEDEYDLASDFLRPVDAQSFSDECSIDLISRTEFRRRYVNNVTPGRPRVACIVDYAPSGSTAPIRRVKFHQPPSTAMTIPYSYITSNLAVDSSGTAAANMTNDTDEPIVPLRYRHAIFYHALYNWYRDRKDDTRAQEAKGEFTDIMLRIAADHEVGGKRPQIRPRISHYAMRARRPWRGGGGRFDINGRFDRNE